MGAPDRDPNIISFKERAAERNFEQGLRSCETKCFQNSPENCPQLKKNWMSPLFIGSIIVALIGSEAIHYQADAGRDAALKAAQETGQATRDAGRETAQATRDAGYETAQAMRDTAAEAASNKAVVASAPSVNLPSQDGSVSDQTPDNGMAQNVPNQGFNLLPGMHLALSVRGASYNLIPAYYKTTAIHVRSGSILLTVDHNQKILCKAGESIKLFWMQVSDFVFRPLQDRTVIDVGDVQPGKHLTESDCSNVSET